MNIAQLILEFKFRDIYLSIRDGHISVNCTKDELTEADHDIIFKNKSGIIEYLKNQGLQSELALGDRVAVNQIMNKQARCYYCSTPTENGRFCSVTCINNTFSALKNNKTQSGDTAFEIKLNDIPNNTDALSLDDGWIYKDDKSITRLCLSCGSPFVIKLPHTGRLKKFCTLGCVKFYGDGVRPSVGFSRKKTYIDVTSPEILELDEISIKTNLNNLSYLINLAVSNWLKRYKGKESEGYYSGKYKERKEMDKNEASEFLGISTRMVERYEKEGRLSTRTIRVGRTRKNIYDEKELSQLKSELNAIRVRPKIEQNDSNDSFNGLSASQTNLLSDLGIIKMCRSGYSFTENSKEVQCLGNLVNHPSIRRRVKAYLGLSLNDCHPIELIRHAIGKLGFSLKSKQEQVGDETVIVHSVYPRDTDIAEDNHSIEKNQVSCYSVVKDVATVGQNSLPFSDESNVRKQHTSLIDGIMEIDFDKWNAIIDNL